MTSVAPPPPPPPPSAGGSAAQLTVTLPPANVASLELSKLALDSLINGLVKQTTTQGNLQVQTNLGLLQFKAPFALPEDTQATFRLVQKVPNIQLQLVGVNNKPVSPNIPAAKVATFATQTSLTPQTQTALPPSALNANATGAGPATLLSLNSATGFRAFVLTPSQAQGFTSGAASPSNMQGQINPPSPNMSPMAATSSNTPTGAPSASGQNSHPMVQPGNDLKVRLLSVQQEQQGGKSFAQSPQNQNLTSTTTAGSPAKTNTVIIQGTIMGNTAQGQPVVKTAQGLIALDIKAKMPEGTQVKLEILSATRPDPQAHAKPVLNELKLEQGVGKNWPTLEEIDKILTQSNPAAADNLHQAMIPKADHRLAANMIFFLKALGRGNFKNWADDKVMKALSKARPDLLKKLENDFTQISDKIKTPSSTDWKIAYIPLQDNGQINQIRLAERDHKDEKEDGKEDPGVRFVIDLHLSRLGAMQLDGLTKESNRMFDLIIRTHKPLAGFIRRDILEIYENAMDTIGFDGKLSFQVTPNFIEVDGVDLTSTELNLGMLV
ncbi:hypothetical protein GCM10011332_07060 [Terasakiella brassicae]|uniref:Uncharacterized protein n=1 Tax=Terasakiella brassicae TaxID=1634917 RepID=A0A917BSV1_9PROT|nr:hypothetical protein [Terasakiella brassicae]GGF56159.1 hypothetical protein GCM10011332_07060 [Terasakiella brassicae]